MSEWKKRFERYCHADWTLLRKVQGEKVIIEEEKTKKIINACMEVHNELGNGFLEPIYQEALEEEFKIQNIPYE